MIVEVFVAVSDKGESVTGESEKNAKDYACESGFEVFRVIKVKLNVPFPAVAEVEIDVPPESLQVHGSLAT